MRERKEWEEQGRNGGMGGEYPDSSHSSHSSHSSLLPLSSLLSLSPLLSLGLNRKERVIRQVAHGPLEAIEGLVIANNGLEKAPPSVG